MQHSALVVIDLQNDITKNYKEIKDFQARNPWRRACAGDECRIRAYLYKNEK